MCASVIFSSAKFFNSASNLYHPIIWFGSYQTTATADCEKSKGRRERDRERERHNKRDNSTRLGNEFCTMYTFHLLCDWPFSHSHSHSYFFHSFFFNSEMFGSVLLANNREFALINEIEKRMNEKKEEREMSTIKTTKKKCGWSNIYSSTLIVPLPRPQPCWLRCRFDCMHTFVVVVVVVKFLLFLLFEWWINKFSSFLLRFEMHDNTLFLFLFISFRSECVSDTLYVHTVHNILHRQQWLQNVCVCVCLYLCVSVWVRFLSANKCTNKIKLTA